MHLRIMAILFVLAFTHLMSLGYSETFPSNFTFGAASAAYQIEGAWDLDGKGESMWDFSLHKNPELVDDRSNGDISCDSYNQWPKDIEMLKFLGVDFYRFSLSWSRILPNGKTNQINQAGIDYYNKLINGLLAEGIQPYVTLYHWDLPQALEKTGGFLNRTLVNDFVNYARIAFKNFGDRVKIWFTFNEPSHICEFGYNTGTLAPFIKSNGYLGYQCGHTLLLAHAKTYRMYQKEFKSVQNGQIGLVTHSFWYEPKYNTKRNIAASIRSLEMQVGWFFNPIVYGNYPNIIIERIRDLELEKHLNKSHFLVFRKKQQKLLKGTFDFLGVNHYTTKYVEMATNGIFSNGTYNRKLRVIESTNASWPTSKLPWLFVVPEGFQKMLVWISEHYEKPRILITENGFADDGRLNDYDRVHYLKTYLRAVSDAIYINGCNIIGYAHWSLMDNFEWTRGLSVGFGLFKVDFNDTERTRTPKESSKVYKEIIANRKIPT